MAPGNPAKKRRTQSPGAEGQEENEKGGVRLDVPGARDDSGSSADEHMDIDAGNGAQSGSNAHRKDRKRPNGAASAAGELTQLTQMSEYKSNVFRMETEELLAQLKVDYERRMGPLQKALHKLKAIVDSIPAKEPALIVDAEKEMAKKHKIMIPFPNPRPAKDVKYKFGYQKPSYVNVVGSLALKTMVKESAGSSVDLALQVPSSLFQEKDYLNHRYFHKRAYYLACIASGINDAQDFKCNLAFGLFNGDPLRPVLIVSPSGDGSEYDFTKSKSTIRITLCIAPDVFPARKLGPSKNCVRPANQTESAQLPPTPSYNASLLSDTTYFAHLKRLHLIATQCAAFRDACMLGRVWLRQRGFSSDVALGGFGSFEWAILMAYLMNVGGNMGGHVLAPGYSNYQLFKATLQFLSTRDLIKEPLMVNPSKECATVGEMPVLMDGEHGYNLFFKMKPWSYKMLRREAALTIKALNSSTIDQFDAVFLSRVEEPYLRYDLIATIPITPITTTAEPSPDDTDPRVTYARRLYKFLAHGLTDRVVNITLKLPIPAPWGIKKCGGDLSELKAITVCFLLNGEKCHRVMDHGPSAENKKETAAFRKFWGEKAELRRFKDGSILESVYWGDSKDAKTPVIQQVINYIIKQHFSPEAAQGITFVGDEYTQLLSKHQIPGASATTKLFQSIMTGYETLVRDLRSIEDLPLIIRHIAPVSPALRYATIQAPLPGLDSAVLMDPPADVVLQFESSGRWPDDLVAIQRTKIAFLLRIGQLLEESATHEPITTRVGLENQEPSFEIFNSSFLDVIYHSGPSFRIRIHHEREPYLLERRSKDKTLSPYTRELASQALSIYNRTFIKLPLHTTAIAKLCHRYAFLSPTIRLVKKWFAQHLLSSHFPDELIELFVVRTFVSPFPWSVPSSVMTGFLRTLEFLATWDWRVDPLIVDTSDGDAGGREDVAAGVVVTTLKPADIESIMSKFEAIRKSDPGFNRIVLIAATNYDTDGLTWTENGPSRVVAVRMTALASAAVEFAKVNESKDMMTLFTHSLKDYDFVIHLDRGFLPGGKKGGKKGGEEREFKNLQLQVHGEKVMRVGFDPAGLFLRELAKIYSTSLVFFHGTPSSPTIGCLWAPHTSTPRPWKVNIAYSTIPTAATEPSSSKDGENDHQEEQVEDGDGETDRGTLTANRAAIINEIARLGGELVERIEVNR